MTFVMAFLGALSGGLLGHLLARLLLPKTVLPPGEIGTGSMKEHLEPILRYNKVVRSKEIEAEEKNR